jgi:hypothetical protein
MKVKKVVILKERPNWTLKEYKKEAQRLLTEFQRQNFKYVSIYPTHHL